MWIVEHPPLDALVSVAAGGVVKGPKGWGVRDQRIPIGVVVEGL